MNTLVSTWRKTPAVGMDLNFFSSKILNGQKIFGKGPANMRIRVKSAVPELLARVYDFLRKSSISPRKLDVLMTNTHVSKARDSTIYGIDSLPFSLL
jgi:hypothetical protein